MRSVRSPSCHLSSGAGEWAVRQAVSLQVGAVRLRERFGQDRDGAQAFLDEGCAKALSAFELLSGQQ